MPRFYETAKKLVILIPAIVVISCCLEQDEPRLPEISIEFLDSSLETDIFTGGNYSLDDIMISTSVTANQSSNVPFNVSQLAGKTIVTFGAGQDNFTVNIGTDITVQLAVELLSEDKGCYTDLRINDVSVSPYGYVASSDVNLVNWSVIVYTN